MRHIIVLTTVVALFAGALGSFAFNALFVEVNSASSATVPLQDTASLHPSSAVDQIKGDIDCDGDVDAVDALKDLQHVAALGFAQTEPCTDVGNVIPAGDGVPGPQGPAGPQGELGPVGPQGEQGGQGPSGISGWEMISENGPSNSTDFHGHSIICPDGKRPLGGGARVQGSLLGVALVHSNPQQFDDEFGWSAMGREIEPQSGPWHINVRVICADVAE